jgi:hypothetical protein
MWTKLSQALHVVILVLSLTTLLNVTIIYRKTMERVLNNELGSIRKEARVA